MNPPSVTKELAVYKPPTSMKEISEQKGSERGLHAVESYLGCPERSRLNWLGLKKKVEKSWPLPLFESGGHLLLGSVLHALRAVRIVLGPEAVYDLIGKLELFDDDRLRLINIFKVYDSLLPLSADGFKYLGAEIEAATDIGDGRGGPLIRTVRYDSVIQSGDGVLSAELKSTSRGGANYLTAYTPQFTAQTLLWNCNPHLVEKYGPMTGVLTDSIVKTIVPLVERHGPNYVSKFSQLRMTEYLRLPEKVTFPASPDGSYPRFLHSCWGKFSACEYVDLCWENSSGQYEVSGP